MKRIIYVAIIVAAILGANAKAQNSLYNKYEDMSNVTSVYISKAMLSMSPKVVNQDLVISKVANQLNAIYIISTYDPKIKKEMKEDIKNFINKGKYELLMKQKGSSSSSAFYFKQKGDKVTDLVMVTEGAKEKYTHLTGEMSFSDIQRITLINGHSYNFTSPINNLDDLKGLNDMKNLDQLKDLNFSSLNNFDFKYGID